VITETGHRWNVAPQFLRRAAEPDSPPAGQGGPPRLPQR
jgi:hypothetical protein